MLRSLFRTQARKEVVRGSGSETRQGELDVGCRQIVMGVWDDPQVPLLERSAYNSAQ